MKRLIAIMLVLVLVLSCGAAMAKSKVKKLADGEYIVGEDIDAGAYLLVCTKTVGEAYGQSMDFFSKAFAGLGEKELSDFYGAYGDFTEDVIKMEVSLLNAKGKAVESFEMEADGEEEITLEDGMTLKIEYGKCTLERIEEED